MDKKLRILVVTECFWPDIYAVNDIVEKLVQRGHEVTVLTGLPDYTTTRIPKEYMHGKNRHQNYKGADVYRVQTIARHHGPIWRSLSYLSFVVAGSFRAKTQNFKKTFKSKEFDVIYVWEVSPVTMAVPAIYLKKRYKKPLFLYCMDIWPECVKAMNINEGTVPYKMIHCWTRSIYSSCDHIAVSSRPFFDYMNMVNSVSIEKMSYLPQYGDSRLLEMDSCKSANTGNSCDFVFIGNIGNAQNLETLIHAMLVFKDRFDVKLHMVGGGTNLDNIKRLTHDLKLEDNIIFYGPKPFDKAIEFYKMADACVMTLDGSNHIGDTLPGKLQTYMAAGKPIFAAANGATADVIKEAMCGKCVMAGDYKSLGVELSKFVDNRSLYDHCGKNARNYFVNNFMEEQHFEKLESELTQLINKNEIDKSYKAKDLIK